jgi:hypothetical protein
MAGIYGFLHDQISYTVSPEYFTHLKFIQFNIPESMHNRLGAGLVGIKATWWMGLIIGIILIPTGLIIPGWNNYKIIMLQAFIGVLVIAFVIGILSLIYGLLTYNAHNLPLFNIPDGVKDRIKFCIVGNMHNFSYIGGFAGAVFGIVYILIKNFAIRKMMAS